jgi:hypothetical protein
VRHLNLKKFFLYLLIASVAFSAIVGIFVILFGNFGEFETKILLTTLAVTVTSILGLANGAYLETGRGRVLPILGIFFSAISAVLWISLVWYGTAETAFFAKLLLSINLFAAACSHASLLSVARLDRRFIWARYAAHASVWSLAAILLYSIWRSFENITDFQTRIIGVLSIAVAALTIVTPIFHRLSGQKDESEEIDAQIARLKAEIFRLEKRREEITNAGEKFDAV